jgi:hypothetical protein
MCIMTEVVINGITEEQISQDAPRMRALLAMRYEKIWQTCEPHINGDRQAKGLGSDPRFIEAGIRVLRDLGRLYKLDRPSPGELVQATGVDVAALVSTRLAELEARMSQADPGPGEAGEQETRS